MVSCEQVLKELSNYIDETVNLGLREQIEEHLRMCHRCSVVLDTTKKVIRIYSDEGLLEIPVGYSERLHSYFKRAAKR